MKISKNNYSPNDRFLIKIFIKIISLDSSQRVPPMSPCPPLIISRVCPWLINHLSDPWNFNKSNGILLRSNWRKPYPKFYGSELLIIKGSSRKLARRYPPTFWGGGGLLIRCWHYIIFEGTILKNINGLNKCGCKYCVILRQCLFHFRGLKYIPQAWPILDTLHLCCCWFVNIPFYRTRTCAKLNYLSMVYPATLPVAESTACIFFCKLGLLMWPQWATVARGNAPDGDTVSDVRFELWLLGGFFSI